MKHLLVALDFSPVSEDVLARAAALAQAFGSEATLVHVAAPDPGFVGYEAGPQSVRDVRAQELRKEHRDLQAAAESLRRRGLDATALMVQGPTVETLLEEADKLEADAIVVGSHGRGALHRALLGSVSEGVVRGARCPVLVVPDRRREGGSSG